MAQPNAAAGTSQQFPKMLRWLWSLSGQCSVPADAQTLEADGERQKATFHVPHCAEAQPSSWCHQAEDAAYQENWDPYCKELCYIQKKPESITHCAEKTSSVLSSNVQLKTAWGGMDLWVKESSRINPEVSGTSSTGQVTHLSFLPTPT